MEINNGQKAAIYNSTEEMIRKIKSAINEIVDAKEELYELRNREKLNTYYTWTIDERLNEARIRLEMSLTRIDEFREEADTLNLSTNGFY